MMSPQILEQSLTGQNSRSKDYSLNNSKHFRGRSTNEGPTIPGSHISKTAVEPNSLGKSFNVFNSGNTSQKTSANQQVFGILGQQAQLTLNSKGFQSVRASQNTNKIEGSEGNHFSSNRNSVGNVVEGKPISSKNGSKADDDKTSTAFHRDSLNDQN